MIIKKLECEGQTLVCPELLIRRYLLMKKLYIPILLIIFLMTFLMSGCDEFIPSAPEDEYDDENIELSYLKVVPAGVEMTFNQTQKFEVKAYNSDNKLIALDPAQIKWSARYTLCYGCLDFKLSPTINSLHTNFTPTNPGKPGKYEVWVNYGGTSGKRGKKVIEGN